MIKNKMEELKSIVTKNQFWDIKELFINCFAIQQARVGMIGFLNYSQDQLKNKNRLDNVRHSKWTKKIKIKH